jgi:putative DNA primase/helicase
MGVTTAEIHSRLGSSWPAVLEQLGIPPAALKLRKAGPCPVCGGKDRYRFDNFRNRGDFYCQRCGAGTGFDLLMRVHGWSFPQTLKRVCEAMGLDIGQPAARPDFAPAHLVEETPKIARPTSRVWSVLRGSCGIADCTDAVAYLEHRGIWPLPEGSTLRAHPSVEYWDGQRCIGRYPAIVARIMDHEGETVSAHLTYLHNGRKLETEAPRKIMSPLTGRQGCAVRLVPLEGDVLGIAEGLETALAAMQIHKVPTWAALNTSLLTKFEPPAEVKRLVIFADSDVPGLQAAAALMQRLQGRIAFDIKTAATPHNDFNDQLIHETNHHD